MKLFFFTLICTLFSWASALADEARLYPLSVGNQWTYEVKSSYAACPAGKKTVEVLGKVDMQGRKAFELSTICNMKAYLSATNDNVDSIYSNTWWKYLAEPVQDGAEWLEFRANATWKKIGAVKVAAGTFQDCWRKTRKVSYTDWSEFCRGVGLVKSVMIDLAGGTIETELHSYTLR